MKKTIAAILMTASVALSDVVIPLDQWNAMSSEQRNNILNQVNANNLAEQNRILERQTAILRETQQQQQNQQQYEWKPGRYLDASFGAPGQPVLPSELLNRSSGGSPGPTMSQENIDMFQRELDEIGARIDATRRRYYGN